MMYVDSFIFAQVNARSKLLTLISWISKTKNRFIPQIYLGNKNKARKNNYRYGLSKGRCDGRNEGQKKLG